MNHFDSLPDELIVEIFQNFDFTQLKFPDLQLVCKRFYRLCRDPSLQKELRIPSHLSFMQVLLALRQHPSIKTLTIVGAEYFEKHESAGGSRLYDAPLGDILPFGCIYVKSDITDESIPYLLESDSTIDTLFCQDFKTFGTFEANSKNFLSNLVKLRTYRIMDYDMINIANSCQKLKSFSVVGSFSDSAYNIFFERMKSTLTDLWIRVWDGQCGGGISQHALNSLNQCKKLNRLTLLTHWDKVELSQLSKEKLPSLRSFTLRDYEEEEGERKFKNLPNWFHNQNFSQLTELYFDFVYVGPHSLLLHIYNNCPNLVKLSLRGELVGGSDKLPLLRQFLHLETYKFLTCPRDLTSNGFRELLRLFDVGATKMQNIDFEHSDEIPIGDIAYLREFANERGIHLRFFDMSLF